MRLREAFVLMAFTAVKAVTWLLLSLMTIHIQVLGGRAGAGEESIWQPSFQQQMHGQIYVWDLTLL